MLVEQLGYGPNWPSQRHRALVRDDYICQKCGHKGRKLQDGRLSVHVHHKRKIAWFADVREKAIDWDAANDLDNLITLCEECHRVADGHRRVRGFKSI